jgi:cysteine desulfurase
LTARVYLDWNATAPLRPEARAAALAAMDLRGNPSSVHAEGRAARAVVERARAQVAALAGCEPDQVVFTSGATEAAAMTEPEGASLGTDLEHDCVRNALRYDAGRWRVGADGRADIDALGAALAADASVEAIALTAAQNETGVLQDIGRVARLARDGGRSFIVDAAQALGRVEFGFASLGAAFALVSAHKLGGLKGVGALIARDRRPGLRYAARAPSATHERGLRAGTENVAGIAAFGAAAEAARRDLENGVWERVRTLRDQLERRLADAAPATMFMAAGVARLPNTSCFAVPGWKGETQVMQLDLAGFAVSAGAACSSGKVGPSRALRAMGCDDIAAASAIRVSLGPATTSDEIARFCDAWIGLYAKRRARAA